MGINVQLFIIGTAICALGVIVVLGFIHWRVRQQQLDAVLRHDSSPSPDAPAPRREPLIVDVPTAVLATPIRPSAVERIFDPPRYQLFPRSSNEVEHETPAVLMIGPGNPWPPGTVVHTYDSHPDAPIAADVVSEPHSPAPLPDAYVDHGGRDTAHQPPRYHDVPTIVDGAPRDTIVSSLEPDQLPTPFAFPARRD